MEALQKLASPVDNVAAFRLVGQTCTAKMSAKLAALLKFYVPIRHQYGPSHQDLLSGLNVELVRFKTLIV